MYGKSCLLYKKKESKLELYETELSYLDQELCHPFYFIFGFFWQNHTVNGRD